MIACRRRPPRSDRWQQWYRPVARRRAILRPGDIGARDRVAQVLHRDAIGGKPRQIRLHPHRRLQAAQHRHASYPGNLAQPLRQNGVGEIAHGAQRHRVRAQRQCQNRSVGRVHLGIGRRIRQGFGQHAGGGVDRGCTSWVAPSMSRLRSNCSEIWLTRTNWSTASTTARESAELTLQRRGDQGSDHIGLAPGNWVVTCTVGKSTCGSADTGSAQ